MRSLIVLSALVAVTFAAPQFVFLLPQGFEQLTQDGTTPEINSIPIEQLTASESAPAPTPEVAVEAEVAAEPTEVVEPVPEAIAVEEIVPEAIAAEEIVPEVAVAAEEVIPEVAIAAEEVIPEAAVVAEEVIPEVAVIAEEVISEAPVEANIAEVPAEGEVIVEEVVAVEEVVPVEEIIIEEVPVAPVEAVVEVVPVAENEVIVEVVPEAKVSAPAQTEVVAEPIAVTVPVKKIAPVVEEAVASGKSFSSAVVAEVPVAATPVLNKAVPAPAVNQIDPFAHVDPRFRNFIYANDAPDVVAAKVALFRIHAQRTPVRKTILV